MLPITESGSIRSRNTGTRSRNCRQVFLSVRRRNLLAVAIARPRKKVSVHGLLKISFFRYGQYRFFEPEGLANQLISSIRNQCVAVD